MSECSCESAELDSDHGDVDPETETGHPPIRAWSQQVNSCSFPIFSRFVLRFKVTDSILSFLFLIPDPPTQVIRSVTHLVLARVCESSFSKSFPVLRPSRPSGTRKRSVPPRAHSVSKEF